jgi:hypothetical protein
MQKNDRLKGKIYKLLNAGKFKSFEASFEITEDLPNKLPGTYHLAFANNSLDQTEITLCHLDVVPTFYLFSRTMEELLTNITDISRKGEVYPKHVLWFFQNSGLTMKAFQDLVRRASEERELS